VADYAALLRTHAVLVLEDHPDLTHEWHAKGSMVTLSFLRRSAAGFDVTIETTADALTVTAGTQFGGTHVHFDPGEYESPDALVAHALGLVRDLLSAGMRLRVREAGRTPYRWHLESNDGTGWHTEHTTGQLLWPFWRRTAERIYQNNILPLRHSPVG
jgi:hypothetical protein